MPLPATSGQFRTKLEDLQIGDYIAYKCTASTGSAPIISDIGAELVTAQANEIPVNGTSSPNGYAYAIKTDVGICVSDRVAQHSISWNVLNAFQLIQGKILLSRDVTPSLRSSFLTIDNNCYEDNIDKYGFYNAFTKNANGLYYVAKKSPASGVIIFDEAVSLRSFCIGGVGTNYTARDYSFSGSNDNINYKILYTGSMDPWGNDNPRNPVFGNITKYKYYRFDFLNSYSVPAQMGITLHAILASVRSITGGNSYLGPDGKSSLTNKGLGIFPSNNEWDKYIVNSTLEGKIIAGDDKVWNHKIVSTWCRDTPINNLNRIPHDDVITTSSGRIIRKSNNDQLFFTSAPSCLTDYGFRPVIEYLEKNSKADNLFY